MHTYCTNDCLLKTFLRTLDELGISLPVFPSRTNLKLHNISVTCIMVKKVITKLDSSKASHPDRILVVVLEYCKLKLSFIIAELFIKCLKESCYQIVGRSHL